MSNTDISIAVIAGNTADTLPIFFKWAIVHSTMHVNMVVQPDNFDNTLELCQEWQSRYPDRLTVQIHKFDNFSAQFQRAIDMCKTRYCLQLGADEILDRFPYEKFPSLVERLKCKAIALPRYNLQKYYTHYTTLGYPDYQLRVFDIEAGVGMNGKDVDETLNVKPFETSYVSLPHIIHFGHIRPERALLQKGKDRIRFADVDACDGPDLKKHGESWFSIRNAEFEKSLEALPWLTVQWINIFAENRFTVDGKLK